MNKINLDKISNSPGCYLMKDLNDNIIYIGKAKNLKKRVSQYFNKTHENKRIEILVSKIFSIDTILTSNEKEALLLEANLVKKYNPKYNVLLKDDKHFPYVKLNLNSHPKLEIARAVKKDNSLYFGPFSDSTSAYKSIELLNRIIPIRKCKNLPKKPCLYYYMDMCIAPCINKIEKSEYDKYIKEIVDFYNGNSKKIKNKLIKKMEFYSSKLKFERANEYKKMIDYLNGINEKQKMDFLNNKSIDFFALHFEESLLSIVGFMYRNGILISKKTFFYEEVNDIKEAFELFLTSYYQKNIKPKELVIPPFVDMELIRSVLKVKVNSYSKGRKNEILKLAGKNAIDELNKKVDKNKIYSKNLNLLSKILNIKSIEKIDLFDISHFSGEDAVGAKINFDKNKFNKNNYRKYIIDKENGGNDYLSMKEIVYRRLFKIIEKEEYKPDLIIVDGGKIQVKAAVEAKKELNLNDLNICGLIKDKKHKTSHIINENFKEIKIDKKSSLFYFLENLQDEVHRFAINFHSAKRRKNIKKSILDDIKGLGIKRKKILLEKYKTIDKIKTVSVEELSQYLPMNVAILLKKRLENEK